MEHVAKGNKHKLKKSRHLENRIVMLRCGGGEARFRNSLKNLCFHSFPRPAAVGKIQC